MGLGIMSKIDWEKRYISEAQPNQNTSSTETRTLDDSTVASLPGQIKISYRKYLSYYRDSYYFIGAVCLGVLMLSGYTTPWCLLLFIFLVPLLRNDYYQWIRTNEQFIHGCVNPAKVIDADNGLIAMYADLANQEDKNYPVIKIVSEPLSRIKSRKLRNGFKIATVSIYERDANNPDSWRWADFHPLMVDLFSNDSTEIKNTLNRISEEDWEALESGIKQLGANIELGLYPIDLPFVE